MTNAANDEFYDDDIPFSSGDEQAIIDYLLTLPPKERERVAWHVMMHGVPACCSIQYSDTGKMLTSA